MKDVLTQYNKISRNIGQIPAFLSSPFAESPAAPKRKATLDESGKQDVKMIKTLLQDNHSLATCSVSQAQHIERQQTTIDDLSAEKVKLMRIPNSRTALETEVQLMKAKLAATKRAAHQRYETKRRACNDMKRQLLRQNELQQQTQLRCFQLQDELDSMKPKLQKEKEKNARLQLDIDQLTSELNHVLVKETKLHHENNRFS